MAQKQVLGRGINSLIQNAGAFVNAGLGPVYPKDETKEANTQETNPSKPLEVTGPTMVAISEIKTNPDQPRKIFKEQELKELSLSIEENGIIQPLLVKKLETGFELIAGERRLRAAQMAGLESVPVIIKNVTDREKMILSIIENVQRSDLNCVEEALAYFQLMEDFQLTQEEVGKKLGKERSSVANYLRVLKLPREVIEMLQKEILSFGHAKLLVTEKDPERTIKFANLVAKEGLSVRSLEKLLKKKEKIPEEIEAASDDNLQDFDQLRSELEQKTGFHFSINNKKNGTGQLIIKYNSLDEFNNVYKYFMDK